jgi:hypothetical protein
MKQYLKWTLMFSILLVVLICLPSLLHAQGANPYCDPLCNCRVNPADPTGPPIVCPIDGGLSVLLAIGVGYGIKKYRDSKRSPSIG